MNDSVAKPAGSRCGLIPLCLWVFSVVASMGILAAYSNQSGSIGAAPERWPAHSAIQHRPEMPTLLIFLHPRCPCSAATVRELNRLLQPSLPPVTVTAVFVHPSGAAPDWLETEMVRTLRKDERVDVVIDVDGTESRRFGALTSGVAMLFDRDGVLSFHGGITPGRGHEGDNRGRSALAALIQGGNAASVGSPVFGCPLFDDRQCGSSEQESICPNH